MSFMTLLTTICLDKTRWNIVLAWTRDIVWANHLIKIFFSSCYLIIYLIFIKWLVFWRWVIKKWIFYLILLRFSMLCDYYRIWNIVLWYRVKLTFLIRIKSFVKMFFRIRLFQLIVNYFLTIICQCCWGTCSFSVTLIQ